MTDDITEKQKLQQTHTTFQNFVNQFGENDVIKEAFFDILLEVIYGDGTGENISLPSKTGQEQHTNPEYPGIRDMPTYEIE